MHEPPSVASHGWACLALPGQAGTGAAPPQSQVNSSPFRTHTEYWEHDCPLAPVWSFAAPLVHAVQTNPRNASLVITR
jgi:hypothetical protein